LDTRATPGIIPYIVPHELPGGAQEFTLAPEGFHESFCADLPADDAAFYAVTQRPLAGVALSESAQTPAWPQPSGLGAARDCRSLHRPRGSPLQLRPHGRHGDGIEGGSHVIMISHPKEVAEVVMTAVRACSA
jgi:hypothetical protein